MKVCLLSAPPLVSGTNGRRFWREVTESLCAIAC